MSDFLLQYCIFYDNVSEIFSLTWLYFCRLVENKRLLKSIVKYSIYVVIFLQASSLNGCKNATWHWKLSQPAIAKAPCPSIDRTFQLLKMQLDGDRAHPRIDKYIDKQMDQSESSRDHRHTDRQTEGDAYEPTVQLAQVGSIRGILTEDYCYGKEW